MTKSAAKIGDVLATPGTSPFIPPASGAWMPGAIVHTADTKLTSAGVALIHQAECTFIFVGTDPMGVPVMGTEKVVLPAQKTKLTGSGKPFLVEGDKQQGPHGNKLEVVAANKLKTG